MELFQDTNNNWYRTCSCGRKIMYSNKNSARVSVLMNKSNTCRSCSQEGEKNRNFRRPCLWNKKPKSEETLKRLSDSNLGKKRSLDTKRRISLGGIKRFSNLEERENLSRSQRARYESINEKKKTSVSVKRAMRRPDVRKKHIEALHHSKWIKVRTDKGQLEMLEKWNRLGFRFEPNYQVKTDLDLFYIDGYDAERNVVLEYDSKYHNKPYQKKMDLVRQQKIINILNPNKFWRYDAVNKRFESVLGD